MKTRAELHMGCLFRAVKAKQYAKLPFFLSGLCRVILHPITTFKEFHAASGGFGLGPSHLELDDFERRFRAARRKIETGCCQQVSAVVNDVEAFRVRLAANEVSGHKELICLDLVPELKAAVMSENQADFDDAICDIQRQFRLIQTVREKFEK